MARVGSVSIDLNANSAKLVKELAKANRATKGFAKVMRTNFAPAVRQARNFAALAGGAASTAIVAVTRNTIKWAGQTAKVADKLGIAVDELEGLRLAARLNNIETTKLDTALQRATRRIAEAAKGTGEAKTAFRELGINAQELNKLPLEQKFGAIVDALQRTGNQADRVRLAFKIFDTEGVDLVRFAEEGSEGLRAVTDQARAMGLALSEVDVRQLETAGTAIETAKASAQGLGRQIAVGVSPFVEAIANLFTQVAAGSDGIADAVTGAAEIAVKAFGFIADGINAIVLGLQALRVVYEQVKATVGVRSIGENVAGAAGNVLQFAPGGQGISRALKQFAEPSDATADDFAAVDEQIRKFEELVSRGRPSQILEAGLKEQLALIKKRNAQFRKEIENNKKAGGTLGGALFGSDDEQRAQQEKVAEQLRQRLAGLQSYYASERDVITTAFENKVALLEELHASEIGQEINFKAELEALEAEHTERLNELARRQATEQMRIEDEKNRGIVQARAATQDALLGLLGVFAVKSKKFAIAEILVNKTKSIALAIQNTAVGVTKALAAGDTRKAAIIGALGKIQVAAIAATGFKQIASVGDRGAALGTAINPIRTEPGNRTDTTGAALQSRTLTVDLRGLEDGQIITGRDVRRLIDAITDQVNDGAGGELSFALGVGG